jgi:hypothetical protein
MAMRVGLQTASTFLDLEEGQAHCFAVASYDANGEKSELSSAIIFDDSRKDSEEEREKDEGAKADEADGALKRRWFFQGRWRASFGIWRLRGSLAGMYQYAREKPVTTTAQVSGRPARLFKGQRRLYFGRRVPAKNRRR